MGSKVAGSQLTFIGRKKKKVEVFLLLFIVVLVLTVTPSGADSLTDFAGDGFLQQG